ncbi:MAG TPA: HAD family hydrolase, partial [Acidimicrobiales bacterium]
MLLLCDLDDTLLDRAGAFAAWARRFIESRELPVDSLAWLIEHDDDGYRDRADFFASVRDRFEMRLPAAELQRDFYKAFPHLFSLDPDVEAALARARVEGWRVAVVTNGSPAQEDKILATGLDRLVDTWCISSVEGCRKPDARLLEIAAERCGVPLESAWLIGDAPFADVGAAHAARLPSVWIRRGRNWPRQDYTPTYEAD